jgi:putative FmdB family regulatory protein
MPAYEYTCMTCDKEFIFNRSIQDPDPGYVCEGCGNRLIRSWTSPVSVQFKGSGFYKTDSKKQ